LSTKKIKGKREFFMKPEGKIKTLTNLGLTVDQARLYLALLQCGPATARQLSSASKIARPDIYRIIPTMEKQGIVEKLMTRPISYQAVPAALVLPNMIKHKATEQTLLIKETDQLLANLRCNETRESQIEETSSVMVYGKDRVIQRLKVALAKASISVYVVTSRERFSETILEFADEYKKALKKGIKINIATEQPIQRKAAMQITQHLSKNTNFKVQFITSSQPAVVTVVDNKEAFITMATEAPLPSATALWSKNPSLVALTRSYFECTWINSVELKAK
jgi:HTH-type transcriptional regulator, sugar sensing transcriptional regulator